MDNNSVLPGIWLGHFCLATLAAMVADMCESLAAHRDEATDRDGIEDITETAEKLAEAADVVNLTLGQIAAIVDYLERSYGEESTVDYMTEAGADPEVIAEAQAMKAKV